MEHLSKKTLTYWQLSRLYRGFEVPGVKSLTVERALKMFNEVLGELSPSRPLSAQVLTLKAEVIKGKPHEDTANNQRA